MREDQAIQIYQGAVDPTVGADQGAEWWAEVRAELDAVVSAPDTATAADIIAWWHHDWSLVGQTPKRVASRIRRQALRVLNS